MPRTPDSQRQTCIVVPCYNEERRLCGDAFVDYVRERAEVDFLFVNDGSRDRTLDVLLSIVSVEPRRLAVLDLQPNGGKAAAVRAGLLRAIADGYTRIGYWDADLATPLSAIDELQAVFRARPGIEVVIASRVQLLGRHIERNPARHYAGRVFATLASTLLHMPVYDTQCGAKLFQVTPVLVDALQRPFVSGWVFDVELFARLIDLRRARGLLPLDRVMVEFPLQRWEDVDGSKVRPRDFPLALRDLARIQLNRRK
jgi:glycosyltransferase involved in cell wall biosynthesis